MRGDPVGVRSHVINRSLPRSRACETAGVSCNAHRRRPRLPLGIRCAAGGLVLVPLLALTGCGGSAPRPASTGSPAVSPAVLAKWGEPLFTDDFAGDALDPRRWFVYDYPDEVRHPRSKNSTFLSGGSLRLVGGFDERGKDVSGGVASTVNLMYGRWEARLRADAGAGYSPVVLLWPESENWPTDGEIDAVEVPDPARRSAVSTLHNGPRNGQVKHVLTADFTGWHTVAVEWLPAGVTVYLDGRSVWTVAKPTRPGEFDPIPSTSPMHLALQNDKGCHPTPRPCRNAETPEKVTMYVDDVKIWDLPGELRPGPSRAPVAGGPLAGSRVTSLPADANPTTRVAGRRHNPKW